MARGVDPTHGPKVTIFDYSVAILLLVSGVAGLVRGATREISTVVALVVAAAVAASTLKFTWPLAAHVVHTQWLANALALLTVFILVYVALRLIGGVLTRGVHRTGLSGLDRLLGLGIGFVRALVVLGGFVLLIKAVTPAERIPAWISEAKTYPLASAAADALKAFAPQGLKAARDVAPELGASSSEETAAAASTSTSQATRHDRRLRGITPDSHPALNDNQEETR